jgi:hypothetical protein
MNLDTPELLCWREVSLDRNGTAYVTASVGADGKLIVGATGYNPLLSRTAALQLENLIAGVRAEAEAMLAARSTQPEQE